MNKLMNAIATLMAVFCLMAACRAAGAAENSWWEEDPWSDPERGFNWYPPDHPPAREKPRASEPKAAEPKSIRELTSVDEIHKELLRLRDKALLSPTPKNMYAYLDANQYVMEKGAYFVDMWRRVVWQNPEIDYNVRNPQANFAQTAIKEKRGLDTEALMTRLAKTHGILFFFRSDCEFCQMEAPILRMFKDRYGIDVLAVSMDGGPIKEFPDARADNGVSMAVSQGHGVDTVPAMYLVSRDQHEVIPLGAGVLAVDEILERIRVLVGTKPGEGF